MVSDALPVPVPVEATFPAQHKLHWHVIQVASASSSAVSVLNLKLRPGLLAHRADTVCASGAGGPTGISLWQSPAVRVAPSQRLPSIDSILEHDGEALEAPALQLPVAVC